MIRIATACLAAIVLVSTGAHAVERKLTLNVPGMTCPSCPFIVKTALKRVDGVKSVLTSVEKRTAVVVYEDTQTTTAKLTAATTSAGYKSTILVGPEPKS